MVECQTPNPEDPSSNPSGVLCSLSLSKTHLLPKTPTKLAIPIFLFVTLSYWLQTWKAIKPDVIIYMYKPVIFSISRWSLAGQSVN